MSRLRNWVAACIVGVASVGFTTGLTFPVKADDVRLNTRPAVLQTTVQTASPTVQTVGWRRGGWVGPRVGVGVYGGGWGPRAGVYVAPRVNYAPGYYGPRYGGGYYNRGYYGGGYYGGYRPLRPYRAYGYVTPGYGYYW